MGFCSDTETAELKRYASIYPEIKLEISKVQKVFEAYIKSNKIEPSPRIKYAIMEKVYQENAATDQSYVPLLQPDSPTENIKAWLHKNPLQHPEEEFDNLFVRELPSTGYVTNFIIWAKLGQEQELHTNCNEYLFIIRGSCTMRFEDIYKKYYEGDIIHIPQNVTHSAVVTSSLPMIALVQRRECA
ncbi:MAG: cupin domain-containing protein [Ferruginibacter sp.]